MKLNIPSVRGMMSSKARTPSQVGLRRRLCKSTRWRSSRSMMFVRSFRRRMAWWPESISGSPASLIPKLVAQAARTMHISWPVVPSASVFPLWASITRDENSRGSMIGPVSLRWINFLYFYKAQERVIDDLDAAVKKVSGTYVG